MEPPSESERAVLETYRYLSSAAYPVLGLRRSRGWIWGPVLGVNGPPVVFKTRREARESFSRYLDVLRERDGGIIS